MALPLSGEEPMFLLAPTSGTEQLWTLNTQFCSFQGSDLQYLRWTSDMDVPFGRHLSHGALNLWKQQHPKQPDLHQHVCVIQLRSCFAVAVCSHSLFLPTEHCWRAGSAASASVASLWSSSLTEAHCSRFLSKEIFLCWTQSLLGALWHAAQRRSG